MKLIAIENLSVACITIIHNTGRIEISILIIITLKFLSWLKTGGRCSVSISSLLVCHLRFNQVVGILNG